MRFELWTSKKEKRIQQLEREVALLKQQIRCQPQTVQLDEEQTKVFLAELRQYIEWSTNRITDELKPHAVSPSQRKGVLACVVKLVLSALFCVVGASVIFTLVSNWSIYWTGGVNNVSVVILLVLSSLCVLIGIDIWVEKDRNYLVAIFSALVSLAALIVAFVK